MPKLTLVLDRKPIQVYDLEQPVIRIGRGQGMDILIDNVSVSRRQAELRNDAGSWIVRDLGSSNGTFVNGERVTVDRSLKAGDEISFGKFSIFFDRTLTEPVARGPAAAPRRSAPMPAEGTVHLGAAEVERLQRAAALKRQAHLRWEASGAQGTHYLEGGGALVGRTALCDLQVPAGPKQHVLILRGAQGFEVRNVSSWYRMKVNGHVTARAALRNGDTIEVGPLKLTFMDEVR
ncbi:MAG: FHA domain-containing protein [Candidatus Rokuibacteriota bacterium]